MGVLLDDYVVGTLCKGEMEGDKKTKRMGRGEMLFTQRQLNWRGLNSPCCFLRFGDGLFCVVDVLRELAFLFCSRDWV